MDTWASLRPLTLATAFITALAISGEHRLAAAAPVAAETLTQDEAPSAVAARLAWKRQFGSRQDDEASGIAILSDDSVLITFNSFSGPGSFYKAFLIKYDAGGALAWQHALPYGTVSDIATDPGENVIIVGYLADVATASLDGGQYVARYDAAGALVWRKLLAPIGIDEVTKVASDADGSAFVLGLAYGARRVDIDAVVAKFSATGDLLWSHRFGTPGYDTSDDIAVDGDSNVLICGATNRALAGPHTGRHFDTYVVKYDRDGTLKWSRQFGTAGDDFGRAIAIGKANAVFIAGDSSGAIAGPNQGRADVFVARYSASGVPAWIRSLGTDVSEVPTAMATDGNGNVVVTGLTEGPLAGPFQGDLDDGFVVKYSGAGVLQWQAQAGTRGYDLPRGIATDSNGNVAIVGYTTGALGGPNHGGEDAFVRVYEP